MGILKDLIEKKAQEIVDKKVAEQKKDEIDPATICKYNRLWLDKIERDTGFSVSDNTQRVDNILKKLNERDGHCPCGGMTNDFMCPCKMMREYGKCKCGLFNNVVDLNPNSGTSTGVIKK
jgi:ferredoxin-thioredoxin reductase catalytic subunit